MDNNLVRTDVVFGRRVNMVGNISADLVLESLGKIYIKSRNKSLTLEEVIRSLVTEDPNTSTSRCKIVEGIENLDTSEFKEGTFVFDKLSNILYLFIDDELLELINVAPEGTGFVKRSGDTMTGRLAIYVKNGPPLYVNSSDLVQNLNAQYLNGETAEEFTRRNADEKIGGAWTFLRPTTFESGVMLYKDLVTHGSIGTPSFSSGFGGYGWRMDADTNTLTVDNLVVRKLMLVYELVVNKISATNGSLWVTNAGKVTSVIKLSIKNPTFFNTSDKDYIKFARGLRQGDAFIKTGTVTIRDFSEDDQDPNEPFMTASGTVVHVRLNCWTVQSLKDAKLIIISNDNTDFSLQVFDAQLPTNYNEYPLFDEEFKFDCTFPIVTRDSYGDYKRQKEELIDIYNKILPLQRLSELSNSELEKLNGYIRTRDRLEAATNPYSYIKYVLPYYKYFANGDYYLVGFDSDELPVFKPGDLLRCLKWTYNGIKYYDAIVCSQVDSKYVIQLADSILDKKTTITYNSSLEPETIEHKDDINSTLYETSERRSNPTEDPIGLVEEKDGLVLMGHLWNSLRLNAVYITSTDDGAPFMDVLSGINRPDFSVIYYTPIFLTIKLYAKAKGPRSFKEGGLAIPSEKVEGIPGTLDYYVLNSSTTTSDYTYVKVVGDNSTDYYMIKGYHPNITSNDNGFTCTVLKYLNVAPDKNTSLILESNDNYLLLEDGGHLCLGSHPVNNTIVEEGFFLLESISDKLQLASTRTTRARFGNLDGILDEMFPLDKQPYGYGLYGQNVFLTGEFYLSNGKAVADIGKDAIAFAIAGLQELGSSVDLLRRDTDAAYNLLKSNVYSKGLLRTAGMMISGDTNPGIVMWGNKIIIATTTDEFYGLAKPTALFAEGKIQAKFLEIHDAYSDEVYEYESIPQQYKLELSEREWTEINYSASGTNSSDTSPSTSGGVKIYTYEDNGRDTTLYVRLFTIHSLRTNISDYAVLNNKYNDSESEYYVTPEDPYDAWLVVDLDGDIPDISNLQYATFLINDVEYSGDSREQNNIFDALEDEIVSNEDFDKVLKNVTLWSLRADGTGNLGGRSVFWNNLGDLSVIGSLNSARGSFAKFLYYKNDMYSLLDPGYAGEYPKFLVHNDKLSSALLLVEYESASFDSGYLIQLGYSRLNANQLHILKGYYDYINLSNNEGVLYEKESITMGVLYPLLNLMVIPYGGEQLKFFVICNYVPLITKIDIYYLFAGTYYIVLNCGSDFEFFIKDKYLTGNILTCISGINNMYGGLGYFRNESQRAVANLAGLNIGNTFNFGESSSSNYIYVGGDENWWYIEAKRKKEVEDSGTSVENIHNITAKSLGHKQVKLDNHVIAFKIEIVNEDKHTEGGFSFLLNYNSFADKIIEYVPPMSNDNYEEDVLLKWVKEPYTSLLGNFKLRYIAICGDEDTEDTLHYYIKFMNQAILEDNASASTIQLPVINESSLDLQLLDNVITDITNEDLRLSNSYIDSLTDSNHSSNNNDNVLTVSGKVSNRSAYLYSFLWNNETLLNTEDYTREKTLTGLSPITYIDPQLSSFKSSGSVTTQQGALLLRSFVERECEYINKYLLFLDKLRFNIQNSKTPDISVSTVYISASRSTGTKSFTVTADSNTNWTISVDSKWCFAGVVSSGGLLESNGSGELTIEIRYNANNDYNSRTSIITVKGGDTTVKVTFVQEAKVYEGEYTLSVSPSSLSVPASGGTFTLNVTSNDRWAITGYPNWATFTPMSGSGNGTISVQVTSSSTSRLTPVTIMMVEDFSKTVSFTIDLAGSGSSEGQESGGDLGTYQYSVGLLSDLHLSTDAGEEAGSENDLTNALSVLKQQGVDFICAAGDVMETWEPWSLNWGRTQLDAKDFYDTYTNANSGLSFFSPLGNHDYFGLYEKRTENESDSDVSARVQNIWTQWIQSSNIRGSRSLTYLPDSNNLTYYFTKDNDIYVMLSLDHGGDNEGIVIENGTYTFTGSNYRDTLNARKIISLPSNDSDVNAILSYISDTDYSESDLSYNYQSYSPSSLIWLKNLIESNTDKKIFVFTHYFLPHKPGNSSGVPSNNVYSYANIYSKNSHTTTKDPTTQIAYDIRRGAETLSGMLFWFINKLNNTHKNVYWFSGHSHLTWEHNSGDALKCAHIDNHDYPIVSPASNVYNSNSNTDSLANKIYTKSSMTPKGNSGWWIALPSLSKPRKIGTNVTTLYYEAELSIMDVYTNGIKIKGYKSGRSNGNNGTTYNLEKLVEKNLLMDGTEAGSGGGSEGGSGGGEVVPSGDGITLKITNALNVIARLNGKFVFLITNGSKTDGQERAYSPEYDGGYNNPIEINPGQTRSINISNFEPEPTIDNSNPNPSAFLSGVWRMRSDITNPILIYSAMIYGYGNGTVSASKNDADVHSKQGMYFAYGVPSNTLIKSGQTYEITINSTCYFWDLIPGSSSQYIDDKEIYPDEIADSTHYYVLGPGALLRHNGTDYVMEKGKTELNRERSGIKVTSSSS